MKGDRALMTNSQLSTLNSRIPKGYKQTDVGVIPDNWDVVPMGNIGESLIGLTYHPSDVKRSGVLVLRSSNIQNGRLAFDDNVYVEMDLTERVITKENDILICVRNGSRRLIGKCVLIDKETAGSAFGAFMSVFRSKYGRFILFQFQSDIIKRQINEVMGATINQITSKDLTRFQVTLPPTIAEQNLIACALSDTDALIESLEQLLAKKCQIKQGAMQELLQPKKRWEPTNLESVSAFITKGTTPTTYGFNWVQQGILFLRSECVSENGLDLSQSMFISPEAHAVLSRSKLASGDILMTITGNVGRVVYLDESFVTANMNQHIARIRINNDQVSSKFIYHFLTQNSVRRAFNTITTGQAYPQISLKQVRDAVIPLPSFSEQQAIATILSDMDLEIGAIETKLTKARQLKQGMMHELLTGRIRLVEEVQL
jgi:type I restriction enzyme, S subunit